MTKKIILLLISISLTPIVCFAACQTTTTQWSRCEAENSCKYHGLGLNDQDCVAIIKADSLAWVVWYGRDKCRSHNCTEEQKLKNDYDRVKLGYMNKEAKEFNAREQEKLRNPEERAKRDKEAAKLRIAWEQEKEREKKLKEQRKREAEQRKREAEQKRKIGSVRPGNGSASVYNIEGEHMCSVSGEQVVNYTSETVTMRTCHADIYNCVSGNDSWFYTVYDADCHSLNNWYGR